VAVALSLAEAIGFIAKLLPQLKSLTGARRREYFDRLLAPLYQNMEKVQAEYDRLFLATKESAITLESKMARVAEDDWKAELKVIVENFRRERQTDEGLRDSVRAHAQDSLAAIPWAQERRFYLAVSYYFLRAWSTPLDDERLDIEAKGLIEHGGRDQWPTPSTRLYRALQYATSPREAVELLDDARTDLLERWTQVTARYRDVLTALVMET
jgi:hypothetical protein